MSYELKTAPTTAPRVPAAKPSGATTKTGSGSKQAGKTGAGLGPVRLSPQAIAAAQARQAAAAQPITVDSVVGLLRQLRGGWSKIEGATEKLNRVLEARKDDAAFWNQVVTLGSEKYGQDFMSLALKQAPGGFRSRLQLAVMGGEQELTHAALMNQMSFMAYSNSRNLSDVKNMPAERTPGGNARDLLSTAGYEALPVITGLWGLQIKVFKPKKGTKNKTVVAFRGTEGLNPNPGSKGPVSGDATSQKANESGLDTMADLVAYATAYSQYEANQKAIIDPLFKSLGGDLIATGHSLGGGLAQIAVAKNPGLFSEVYTFQGASIKEADVQKLEQRNKQLKARHFRVDGDAVPSSGEAAIHGQVFDVERHAGVLGNPLNNLNVTGGHNTPLALDMLRNAGSAGLISKGNTLGQALISKGSRDPTELAGRGVRTGLVSTYGTKQDTFPGQENLKQNVTGRVFMPAFISTYQNNIVYNSLAERALPRLLKVKPGGSVQVLEQQLQAIVRDLSNDALTQTASTKAMLEVITKARLDGMARADRGQTGQWRAAIDKERGEFQNIVNDSRNFRIDPRVIEENKQRFANTIADLWYAVHPEAQQQYLELKNR